MAVAAAHRHLVVHQRVEREDHVGGGEGRAVMPLHVLAELDGPGEAVLRDAAILAGGDLLGEVRHEIALGIEPPERIEHDEFDRGLDARVHVEQGVEIHCFLGDAEHQVARCCGHSRAGEQPRKRGGERAGRRQRQCRGTARLQKRAPVHRSVAFRSFGAHLRLPLCGISMAVDAS